MKEIWKYPLDPISQISMPVQAKILAVQEQCGRPCLWALVNVSNPKETRYFAIRGTGHSLPDDPGNYIGTFQLEGGAFVFHVFEILS